jgi:hypothetical protein
MSGTAGSTSFFLKKSCLETKSFSRHAWRINDVVRPKTVEGRKDSQNFSKYSRTCGAVLAADRACEVNVDFTPTELGKVTGR